MSQEECETHGLNHRRGASDFLKWSQITAVLLVISVHLTQPAVVARTHPPCSTLPMFRNMKLTPDSWHHRGDCGSIRQAVIVIQMQRDRELWSFRSMYSAKQHGHQRQEVRGLISGKGWRNGGGCAEHRGLLERELSENIKYLQGGCGLMHYYRGRACQDNFQQSSATPIPLSHPSTFYLSLPG